MTRTTEHIGRVLGGRYRLLAPLGSGASAQVYLADDVRLRRRVAVKVLHPALADDESFLRRFRAEAQSAASLSHPHLLAVYDWSDDAEPFLVTEYLAGGSLRSMLDAGHRLTPAQALVVGLEAARGLDHAHRHGFVHRDIKPANLLFGSESRLRVADFGLARAIAEAGWTEPAGAVLGTARYASPEQARGEPLDGRSDVYSLALVLVEAVTGVVPFTSDTTIGTLMARLDRPIDMPPELGPLRAPVEAAGRLDHAARPDAAELSRALVEAASELARPAPLPLVGTAALDAPADGRDATLLAAAAPTPDASAGAAGADPVGVAASAPPSAAPGAGTPGHIVTARTTTVLHEPPGGVPSHDGASPPWRTGRYPVPGDLSPNDRGARRLMVGAVVVVVAVVVALVGGWFYAQSQIPSYPVPDSLVGMHVDDVPAAVADYEWNIETTSTRRDGTEPGQVLETTPAAGEDLREGATLRLVVSDGATLVDVPPGIAGMAADDATAALHAVGLGAQLVERPSEDVPEGVVIGFADGDPGPQLPKGTAVRLAVSTGDEFDLPDVRGRPYAEAVEQLEGMGLEVELEDDRDRDVAPGHVIRTDPDEGDEVEPGDTVTVVVAVEEVEVPELRGQDLDEATATLEDEGLSVGEVVGPRDGVVMATWPLEGLEISSGTPVGLVMRNG